MTNMSDIHSLPTSALIFDEMREQAGWEREPIADWRKWLGDPRNEETDDEKKAREDKEKSDKGEADRKAEEEKKKKENNDDDEDTEKLSKAEAQRLRRIEKEHREAKEKSDKEKADAERKKKQDEGKWQELVSDAEKKATDAERERDEARNELKTFKFERRVTDVANSLGFRDPSDAHKFLPGDFDKEGDENDIQRALKKVLEQKSYLKDEKKASGNSGGGNNSKGGEGNWTFAEISAMSADEINANWEKPGFKEAVANAKKAA